MRRAKAVFAAIVCVAICAAGFVPRLYPSLLDTGSSARLGEQREVVLSSSQLHGGVGEGLGTTLPSDEEEKLDTGVSISLSSIQISSVTRQQREHMGKDALQQRNRNEFSSQRINRGQELLVDDNHDSFNNAGDEYDDQVENGEIEKTTPRYEERVGFSKQYCWCSTHNDMGAAAAVKCKSDYDSTYESPVVEADARKAVRSVCKMAPQINEMRDTLICQQKAIAEAHEEWVLSDSDSKDAVQPTECNISGILKQMKRDKDPSDTLKRLRKKQQIVEALPAVAAISAVKPLLWTLRTTSDLFYTKANAMQLRAGHKEPFTNDTLRYLPPELPNIQMPTCAIVGNSGILRRHKFGKQIDSATVVVRINQGPATHTYHDIAGSKTHIRVLNRQWTKRYATRHADLLQSPDAGGMIIATRAATRSYEQLGEEIVANTTGKMLLLANHNLVGEGLRLLRSFRNGIQQAFGTQYKGGDSPSSGFLAILLMMQVCTKPTIYGFSLEEDCKQGCGMYHYFMNDEDVPENPRMSAYKGHTYANEGWILKALHILGVVCIEPPPLGIGMCGERLGGRLTKAGIPSTKWGGARWEGLGRLVAEIASDVKYLAKTQDGGTVTWMGRRGQSSGMVHKINGKPSRPRQISVRVNEAAGETTVPVTASRGHGREMWKDAYEAYKE